MRGEITQQGIKYRRFLQLFIIILIYIFNIGIAFENNSEFHYLHHVVYSTC